MEKAVVDLLLNSWPHFVTTLFYQLWASQPVVISAARRLASVGTRIGLAALPNLNLITIFLSWKMLVFWHFDIYVEAYIEEDAILLQIYKILANFSVSFCIHFSWTTYDISGSKFWLSFIKLVWIVSKKKL